MKIKLWVIRGKCEASSILTSTHSPCLPGTDLRLRMPSAAIYKQSWGYLAGRTEQELDTGHLAQAAHWDGGAPSLLYS